MNRADFYKEANNPKKITGLRATKASREYIDKYISEKNIRKKIVTITLRLYEYDKIRNSNLLEWKKFINYLKERDFHPIVIPDTEKAWGKELEEFKEFFKLSSKKVVKADDILSKPWLFQRGWGDRGDW